MAAMQGKVILVVNVASQCGFTPQYKELAELDNRYRSKGLVILGFPCNQVCHLCRCCISVQRCSISQPTCPLEGPAEGFFDNVRSRMPLGCSPSPDACGWGERHVHTAWFQGAMSKTKVCLHCSLGARSLVATQRSRSLRRPGAPSSPSWPRWTSMAPMVGHPDDQSPRVMYTAFDCREVFRQQLHPCVCAHSSMQKTCICSVCTKLIGNLTG